MSKKSRFNLLLLEEGESLLEAYAVVVLFCAPAPSDGSVIVGGGGSGGGGGGEGAEPPPPLRCESRAR